MTIAEAAAALRAKKVSSVELTTKALDRIALIDPHLNSFIRVLHTDALLGATLADKELAAGHDRGPLHGIPVALKDVFHMQGVCTTGGSKLFAQYRPNYDSAVVERLHNAGAVILGKTGMHELAFGVTSDNPHYGPVRNPWCLERVAGGSSGGSGSAVAADLAFMATGTDTGGSVRIPASFCGTVGLKPTSGRISRHGILPFDYTLDHVGILTRTVRDTATTLSILAGRDHRDHTSSKEPVDDYSLPPTVSIRDLRVGWVEKPSSQEIDEEVSQAIAGMVKTAETLGAKLVPLALPDYAAINSVHRVIMHSEAAALFEPYRDQTDQLSGEFLDLLKQGYFLTATDYVNAQRLRHLLISEGSKVFEQVDCLITPTTPTAAPKIGQSNAVIGGREQSIRLATTSFVRAANLLGLPAVSIPCGFHQDRMPLGLQIMGRPFQEAVILRLAAALEDATDFHGRIPPGFAQP